MQLQRNVIYLPSTFKGLYCFLLEYIFILGSLKFLSISILWKIEILLELTILQILRLFQLTFALVRTRFYTWKLPSTWEEGGWRVQSTKWRQTFKFQNRNYDVYICLPLSDYVWKAMVMKSYWSFMLYRKVEDTHRLGLIRFIKYTWLTFEDWFPMQCHGHCTQVISIDSTASRGPPLYKQSQVSHICFFFSRSCVVSAYNKYSSIELKSFYMSVLAFSYHYVCI